jgi:hypothetical protein
VRSSGGRERLGNVHGANSASYVGHLGEVHRRRNCADEQKIDVVLADDTFDLAASRSQFTESNPLPRSGS